MGWFSSGGSVLDDAISLGTKGIVNPGAAKDAKRKAEKKEEALGAEADQLRQEGIEYGNKEFKTLYGTDKKQVGLDMKDIIQRRKDMLKQNANDPVANQIRQSGNDAVRKSNAQMQQNGVKGGAGAQVASAVSRQADRDVNQQLAQKYVGDLNASQQMTGNLANQAVKIPQVYSQLFSGSQYVPPVGQAPFLGGMFDHGILGGIV